MSCDTQYDKYGNVVAKKAITMSSGTICNTTADLQRARAMAYRYIIESTLAIRPMPVEFTPIGRKKLVDFGLLDFAAMYYPKLPKLSNLAPGRFTMVVVTPRSGSV